MNSIPSRLLAILLAVSTVVILGLACIEYKLGQKAIEKDLDQSMRALSTRLQAVLRAPVKRGNTDFVDELVQAELLASDTRAIFVWQGEQETLLCGYVKSDDALVAQSVLSQESQAVELHPIRLNSGQRVGTLGIQIDRDAKEAQLRNQLFNSVGMFIITDLLVLWIMAFIVHRFLVKPLETLRQSMIDTQRSALGEGDPDAWHHLETKMPIIESRGVFPEIQQMGSIYQSVLESIVTRQAALQMQEENLRITFDSIGDAVISTDASGAITRMNPIAEALTGWTQTEARGQALETVFKIINAKSRQPIDTPVSQVLEGGQIVDMAKHTTLIAKDGSERHIADSAAPILTHTKQIQGVVLVFRDVSDDYEIRTAYEDERMRNVNILQGTDAGTWDWNIQTGELILNERWAEIMGYTLKELTPITINTWSDHLHPGDLAAAETELEKHFSGQSDYYDVEFRQKHKDGHWVWVNARGKVILWTNDGKPQQMSGTHLDITERKKTEEALKSTLNLMQGVFDASTQVCVIATEADATINIFNAGAEEMLGYSAQEIIGKESPFIFHDPEEVQTKAAKLLNKDINEPIEPIDYFSQLVADGHDEQEWTFIRKDGRRIIVNLSINQMKDNEGNPRGFLGVAVDITERIKAEQELRESRRMLRKVIDSIPVRVFWKDSESVYLGGNQLFSQDAGLSSPEQLIGCTDFELAWPEQAPLYRSDDKNVMLSGEAKLNYEEPQTRPDGSVTWLRTSKIPLRNETGQVVGVLGTYEDISERKKAEAELIQAKDNAEAANRAKDEFLAVMSHEMRTPLNPILGFADLMRQTTQTEPEATYLDTIISSANRQLNLIDDILDYMRINSNRVEPSSEPLNLVDLCQTALNDAQHNAKDLELTFVNGDKGRSVPEELVVETDLNMLRRILDNLLGNACKYTRHGSITLSLSLSPDPTDNTFIIAVTDTGIGIEADTQQKLFEAFSQADSSYTRNHEGLGLGLAICKKLLDILGGQISVRSTVGKGSCFTLYLPLKFSSENDLHPEIQHSGATHHRTLPADCKVLIVDDKEDNLLIAETLVKSFGVNQIELAHDGREAVQICQKHSFDLILMDLAMPIMNGLEASDTLRTTDNPNTLTPIIAVTADVTRHVRATCSKAGIRGYVSKPIHTEKLFRAMEHSLQSV